MVNREIYDVLIPIKDKTIKKIEENLNKDPSQLHFTKAHIKEVNVICTLEKTFSTCLGYSLQEVASKCGNNVINTDKSGKKVLGIDLRTSFGDGQMKLSKNTQTGTHKKDSINKLCETAKQNNTLPFFAIAIDESYEYIKDGVLYLGGKSFWDKIGIDYQDLQETIIHLWLETYQYVKSTFIDII